MALSYDEIRSILLGWLRNFVSNQTSNNQQLFSTGQDVVNFFKNKNLNVDNDDLLIVKQVINEFYHENIIMPGSPLRTDRYSSGTWEFPFWELTDYGRRVLETAEYNPTDPAGYIDRLKREIAPLSQDIIFYLKEALQCYRHSCFLAATVMLGCASEKAMLELIEAFGSALPNTQKANYEQEIQRGGMKKKYEVLKNRLLQGQTNLPTNLKDDLERKIDGLFNLIRETRNEAGHPTGKFIDRETVYANLVIYPSYCRRVYALIEYFENNPTQ